MLGRATTVGQGDSALANPKYACSFLSSEHAPGGPFSTLQATLPPSDPLRRLLVLICSLFQRWLAVLGCHLSRQTFNLARTPRGLGPPDGLSWTAGSPAAEFLPTCSCSLCFRALPQPLSKRVVALFFHWVFLRFQSRARAEPACRCPGLGRHPCC